MIAAFFLTQRWYLSMGICAGLYVLAFFFPQLLAPVNILCLLLLGLSLLDVFWLFSGNDLFKAERISAPRLSLGDENKLRIALYNGYRFRVSLTLIDELPFQFQERNWHRHLQIGPRSSTELSYILCPKSRGEYVFGRVLAYVCSPMGLVQRRFCLGHEMSLKVYPSFLHLRRYELMASSENLATGIRNLRRLGHSMEFEKIKSYVSGDDIRSINWNASARSASLMVNVYTDTREQQVYCFLDKGRSMKMPFDGLSLLDHSINAALALLHVVMLRQDKAGLLTFSQKINDLVPAERRSSQKQLLLETLYRQETDYLESDFEALWKYTKNKLGQRSLIVLFTHFETMISLERQLPYLHRMGRQHLLCVVQFQNTLLHEMHLAQPDTVEGIYTKTIVDRFDFEQKQIVRELRRHGILAFQTSPKSLSVDVINQYLELKARQMI
ncbi:MAG: DUF58 domain-containing protein [Bacteroidetes bacterium]|nr:DUF58 domain-containing protein [Bacteroidota bacterium]